MTTPEPTVLVTLPTRLQDDFFSRETRERLESLADVTWNERDENFEPEELAERLAGVDVVVTGWGTPTLDESVVDRADDLAPATCSTTVA